MTTAAIPAGMSAPYPVTLEVNPPGPQGRWGVFFRGILAIPHLIILNYALTTISQVLAFLAWFVIVFTGRFPAGLVSLTSGSLRWQARVLGYVLLLTNRYPPFSFEQESEYPVRGTVPVQIEDRNRWTVGFRIFLLIPSAIVFLLLSIAGVVVLLIAWVAALFKGAVPTGMHTFLAGWLRWWLRLSGYAYLAVDQYPPFSMS